MTDYYTTCFDYDWSIVPEREDYEPDFELVEEDEKIDYKLLLSEWKKSWVGEGDYKPNKNIIINQGEGNE